MKWPIAASDTLAQWDIVVLPFPYTDRLAEKRRPALIISKPWLAKEFGLLWIAMITSAGNERWAVDIKIKQFVQGWTFNPIGYPPYQDRNH